MREGGRLKKKEREIERWGSETDVPKLYPTMNMNSLCYMYNLVNINNNLTGDQASPYQNPKNQL